MDTPVELYEDCVESLMELDSGRTKCKYIFSTEGAWVAVAYEDSFFVGQVIKVDDEKHAAIQFLRKGIQDTFKWPLVDDVDPIESKFVFAHDFDVQSGSLTRRTWIVPELDYLEGLYEEYAKTYF